VTHQDWRKLVPARDPAAPDIGRLRPEPYWAMRGPQLATGLIVWSHGYMSGKDATNSAPQPYLGRFTRLGYDLYRFDREWISDWASDATALAAAVSQARQMGYRRIVLAGQSAGAWVSLAAALRSAPVDGVISISAAHHGTVEKMTDPTRARSGWQNLMSGLKAGPRFVVVNFAEDAYDVGGRMPDARRAFAASGVQAVIIDDPPGFKGHGAGSDFNFALKFGACIEKFIESGTRQAPCS
jgi:pimeloyl-ACP methyl ester carboxylesterase